MPAAGEESLQAVLRCETPSDAATFLCAYNERMHVASKGRSSKQSTFHRDFLGEPCVNQARSVLRRRPTLRRQEEEEAAEETEEEEEEERQEEEEEEQQQQRGRRAALHFEGRQCCLGRLRSLDDFQEDRLEESTLSRMTKAAGFTFWFLPKFHSELSTIERCWAVLKYYVRRYHDYAESLRACILLAVKDF